VTIDLTKEQYISLLRIAFLGEWVANSFRINMLEEFEAIGQHIMSYAKEFGADDIAGYDKKLKRWFPTKEMELHMHEYIDEYNEDFFLEALVHRLARRDVRNAAGQSFKRMKLQDRLKAEEPFLEKYFEEIKKNGIENIGILRGSAGEG
jgi:hypothetical protein